VNEFLSPLRARRTELAADPGYLREVLREGNARAGAVASRTLAAVHALMGTGHGAPDQQGPEAATRRPPI